MKRSSSLHLEEDIWKEIEEYKDKYKLSSRNVAVERMFIERRMLLKMCNLQITDIETNNINSKVEDKDLDTVDIEDSRITSDLKNTIQNSFNNMPD